MSATALYDLTPLFGVMSAGLLFALGPLVWVLRRSTLKTSRQRVHLLTVLTLFLTFDLVLFGAFTRLTDSGLGCPDWPGCYGSTSPVGASEPISQAQTAMPTGPVTHVKAWIEMIHRYLATAVGVLILGLTLFWITSRAHIAEGVEKSAFFTRWAGATLIWVCLQGAFGALTVTMKLFPAIVTLHLLGGVVLLLLLTVQVARGYVTLEVREPALLGRRMRLALGAGLLLLLLQIALGGWVSTNYAVLACTDFPKCQGAWWPEMSFDQGFQIWRPLGRTAQGDYLSFAALTTIHWIHRMMALVVFICLGYVAARLRAYPSMNPISRALVVLLITQFATGVSNVVFNWPLVAAVLHTGGAAALAVTLAWALAVSKSATLHVSSQTGSGGHGFLT